MNPVTRWLKGRTGQGAYQAGKKHQLARRFPQALDAFSDAERWLRVAYGPDHLWTSQATVQRAWCLVHLGRLDEAVTILEAELERERRLRGNSARVQMLDEYLARARQQDRS